MSVSTAIRFPILILAALLSVVSAQHPEALDQQQVVQQDMDLPTTDAKGARVRIVIHSYPVVSRSVFVFVSSFTLAGMVEMMPAVHTGGLASILATARASDDFIQSSEWFQTFLRRWQTGQSAFLLA